MTTFKQGMTFVQKGQIFTLHEQGKSDTEISELTQYCPYNIKWLIEGVKNTNAWFDAKESWNEQQSERETTNTYSEHSTSDHTTNKTVHPKRSGVMLSKRNSQGHQDRVRRERRVQSDGKSGGTISLSGDIVNGLRKSVDYIGD